MANELMFPGDTDVLVCATNAESDDTLYTIQLRTKSGRADCVSRTRSEGINSLFEYYCTCAIKNAQLSSFKKPTLKQNALSAMHASRRSIKMYELKNQHQYLLTMGDSWLSIGTAYKPIAEGFIALFKSIGTNNQIEQYWIDE